MTHPELWEKIHRSEKIKVHRKEIQTFSGSNAIFTDGSYLEADIVILSTGWKTKHSIFSDKDCLAYGLPSFRKDDIQTQLEWRRLDNYADDQVDSLLPFLKDTPSIPNKDSTENGATPYRLYRHIIPATAAGQDRSIAFIGMLRTTGAPLVFEAQALWACAYLADKINIPPRNEMEEEVALTNAWIKKRYICGHKVPFALFDFMAVSIMVYLLYSLFPKHGMQLLTEL